MTDERRPISPASDAADPGEDRATDPDATPDDGEGGVRDLLKEGADAPDAADIEDPTEQV